MHERIKHAVDANLSGLVASDRNRLAILNQIEGEPPMRKRMPLSLALAILLILISLAALAAVILSGKDVVDQKIAPMAQQSQGNRFTKEEVAEIIAIAEENGIHLNENALRHLNSEEGYYKEELGMLFAKEQFGFYPGSWNIEEQHWFNQFWRKFDPTIASNAALPEEGELSQDQAQQAALDFFEAETGKSLPLLDKEQYRISRSFTAVKQNPWYTAREWYLDFEPLTLYGGRYGLRMDAKGQVLDHSSYHQAQPEDSPQQQAEALLSRFHSLHSDIYGSKDGFDQATWQDLRARLAALEPFTTQRRDLINILKQGYTPPEGAISREEAIDKAASAVAEKYKLDKASLLDTSKGKRPAHSQAYALYLEAEGQQRWKVSFEFGYLAEIDAISGKAEVVDVYSPGNDYNRRYVLDVLIPEEGRAFATPSPSYSLEELDELSLKSTYYTRDLKVAPAWYWDRLDSYDMNGMTVHAMYYKLESEYGLDSRYWPIDYQALDYMRDFARELVPGMVFPGLPMEGDITQDQAIRIAREAVLKDGQEGYEQDKLDSLKEAISFVFNSQGEGSRVWKVALMDLIQDPMGKQAVQVNLSAIDGQVLQILYPWDEHGMEDGEIINLPFPPTMDSELGWSELNNEGRPIIWGDTTAPEHFWQAMEKDYGSREVVAAALKAWVAAYGENTALWPLLPNAVFQLWAGHQSLENNFIAIAAWPEEGQLSLEDAKALAIKTFQAQDPVRYSDENLKGIALLCNFYYQGEQPTDDPNSKKGSYWQIELSETSTDYNTSIGYIQLDATDDTVLEISTELGNG